MHSTTVCGSHQLFRGHEEGMHHLLSLHGVAESGTCLNVLLIVAHKAQRCKFAPSEPRDGIERSAGARPVARRESLESYIKRITALEEIAGSFEVVDEAYAIQAGRETRIIVKPEEVDDLAIIELSRGIADKVEQNLQYPGQIKVTVIRESRAVDYAR